MATAETRAPALKHSFASVAARAPPRDGPTIIGEGTTLVSQTSNPSQKPVKQPQGPVPQAQQDIHKSMSKLHVKDSSAASTRLDEQARSNIKRAGLGFDDESTHVSSSTNAHSLDGKSTVSGTTFAFDEKDSLRPDDSASVQAVDDDDVGSGQLSGAPNSRFGSEAGSRAFRDQFNEVSANAPQASSRLHPLSQGNTHHTQDRGADPHHAPHDTVVQSQIPPLEGLVPVRPQMPFADTQPDEKLFEALNSPKDRMFLLRLEQNIVDFIQNSGEPKIQLPPCNSFCRLLAHKLGDYYGLTHCYDNTQNGVNLFRTPFTQMRTSLGDLAKSHTADAGVVPIVPTPAMRIMRRPGLSKDGQAQSSGAPTTESSVVPSKAGSEASDENPQGTGPTSPTGSALAKDKTALSRAEREARYKEKREEIFGPQSENADSNEALNEISRVSSRNEEKKRKKKHRTNNDDFEGRSEYYPAMSYVPQQYAQATHGNGCFVPYTAPPPMQQNVGPAYYNPGMSQMVFPQSNYNPMPSHGFPAMEPQNHAPVSFGNQQAFQGYEQQASAQYVAMVQPPMMGQPSSTMSSPSLDGTFYPQHPHTQVSEMQTPRSMFSHPYQPQEVQQQQQYFQPSIPYQMGQLAFQPSMPNFQPTSPMHHAHARPPTFNPQTRSFVPNGGAHTAFVPPSMGNPVAQSVRSPVKAVPNGMPFPQSPVRHQTPQTNPRETLRASTIRRTAPNPNESSSPVPSSLSKWGTPANLPPKPPPPEAPAMPDSLPVNNQFGSKLQPVTAGQPMPHYQNGVYSMPRSVHP